MARDREYDDRRYEDNEYDDRDREYDDRDREYDDRGGERPPNYLVPAILITFCCCTIGGIIALVQAAQVNSKWNAGDYTGARHCSDKARMWVWLSFAIGLVVQPALLYLQIQAELNNP